MAGSQRTANRIQEAERLTVAVERIICDACQDECWSVEVWLHGVCAEADYKTCVLHRGHLSQSQAVRALGSWAMSHARILTDREAEAYLIEHQGTLW